MNTPVLVLATGNPGKAKEVQAILQGVRVQTLKDHPGIEMPPEDGLTFADNAAIKAEHVARVLGCAVLADDSGLQVDALDGGPGVHSARYAEGTDRDRYLKLLEVMTKVPDAERGARFCCAMAFARPGASTQVTEGRCEGHIARAPAGEGGFGYDPVFLLEGSTRSMAELSSAEKNVVSHRGAALAAMSEVLKAHFSLELSQPNGDHPPPNGREA